MNVDSIRVIIFRVDLLSLVKVQDHSTGGHVPLVSAGLVCYDHTHTMSVHVDPSIGVSTAEMELGMCLGYCMVIFYSDELCTHLNALELINLTRSRSNRLGSLLKLSCDTKTVENKEIVFRNIMNDAILLRHTGREWS